MARVTYLSHCGFAVTLDDAVLVFDYLHDPSHSLKKILDKHPDIPVVFFISHSLVNNSHFNPGTFEIAQNHRRIYVISNDVPAKIIPQTLEVAGMSHGDVIEDLPGISKVEAFATTGKGVSFMVTTKSGEKIFHGGELNEWNMPDEASKREYQKCDERFKSIVNHIAEEYPRVDIAMMDVNPRISLDYAQGARIFCQDIKVKDFFPMDVDGDFKEASAFATYLPAGTTGHLLRVPGESINLN